MYLVGIDIAKYSHQRFIATEAGEVIKELSFDNNFDGFNVLLKSLKSLDQFQNIKIGLESTGHYGNTLKQFICAKGYTFVEFNPYLAKQFFKSTTIRKTKTDKVDARKREQGKHHKVAFSAISRKLIRLIYHIESNKIDFDIEQYR